MLFKANLECKIFFIAHPWWPTFETSFTVIFVRKTHESFLKG